MPFESRYKIQKLNKIDASYVAGIVDGEGCFAIIDRGKKTARPLINISNTDATLLAQLSKLIYGSSAYISKQKTPKGNKWVYRLTICGKSNARDFVEQVMPYLKTKNKVERAGELLLLCGQKEDGIEAEKSSKKEILFDTWAKALENLNKRIDELDKKIKTTKIETKIYKIKRNSAFLSAHEQIILDFLKKQKKAQAHQLANALKISRSNASLKLNKLYSIGILNKKQNGKDVFFKLK